MHFFSQRIDEAFIWISKNPDVIRTSPYDPICNAKGGICSGASLGPTQDVNLIIIHTISF